MAMGGVVFGCIGDRYGRYVVPYVLFASNA